MLTFMCPTRKLKMLLSKRQSLVILKASVFMFAFSIYFIVLIRESMNVMENAKSKTVSPKVDNSKEKHHIAHSRSNAKHNKPKPPSPPQSSSNNHHNRHSVTRKPPVSYLIPNPKFHHATELKSSVYNSTSETTTATAEEKDILTTVNPVYEYSEEINAQAERDFNKRRQHLWEVCEQSKLTGKLTPNAWEFFVSPGHGIAWCNVFKAASTTWMYHFNILAGYDPKYLQRTVATPLELARKRFPRPSLEDLNEALENSISFLIVREPFERLLSAYRNKMEEGRNTYYKLLGDQIVKKFRLQSQKSDTSGPTFKEFLQFLVQHYKSGGRFDEHWSPVFQFCTPCSINFTLIAKMETFKRDSEYIIRQAGLETLLLNKVPKQKETKISNRSKNNTNNLIPKYFSQIDRELLREILKIYQLDFDLFDYDSSKYFMMVQQNSRAENDVNSRVDFESRSNIYS